MYRGGGNQEEPREVRYLTDTEWGQAAAPRRNPPWERERTDRQRHRWNVESDGPDRETTSTTGRPTHRSQSTTGLKKRTTG